jgi:hypothetical protein
MSTTEVTVPQEKVVWQLPEQFKMTTGEKIL